MAHTSNTWRGVIEHYRDRVEITRAVPPITLLEGNTPLIPAPRLAKALAQGRTEFELLIKFEASNPTGSFKDRGMTAAITQAVADGAQAVLRAGLTNQAELNRVLGF